jgi:hypothetical protein
MPYINDPETRAALNELGCLAQDKLNTKAFARVLAQRLESEHVAADKDDVARAQTTTGQLVAAVTGRHDEQLVELAKPMLSTGADGAVQKALSNGYALCAGRARFEVAEQTISLATRFLSQDPDVVMENVFDARMRRAKRTALGLFDLKALVVGRQPEMAERLGSFVEELNAAWQRALTTGAEE